MCTHYRRSVLCYTGIPCYATQSLLPLVDTCTALEEITQYASKLSLILNHHYAYKFPYLTYFLKCKLHVKILGSYCMALCIHTTQYIHGPKSERKWLLADDKHSQPVQYSTAQQCKNLGQTFLSLSINCSSNCIYCIPTHRYLPNTVGLYSI